MMTARAALDAACSESQFQAAVVKLARYHGWRVQYHWTEKHSPAGWPDLTLWRLPRDGEVAGRVLLVELKTQKGKVTKLQAQTIGELCRCGLDVHLWRPSDWPEIERCLAYAEDELLEGLAAIEHEQWSQWVRTMMASEVLTTPRVTRWKQLLVPYDQLPESVKEQDREYARRALALFQQFSRGMSDKKGGK